MKALVFEGPGKMAWRDWPDTAPGPGEALVAIDAVGICGSDVHGYAGASGRRVPPMVMGHEAAGRIVDIGPGDDRGRLGERVFVQPFRYCGTCLFCRGGRGNLCANRRFAGVDAPGAMAERIVMPLANLVGIPDDLLSHHAALAEPLSVAIHATRVAGQLQGRRLLVAGAGAIGLLTLLAARLAGAAEVFVSDLHPVRLDVAAALGGTSVPDVTRGPQDLDIAIDAAGVDATLAACIGAVRPGGTVIALSGWQKLQLDTPRLVAKEIELRGSFNFTGTEFVEATRWLSQQRIAVDRLVRRTVSLDQGAAAFADLVAGTGSDIKIVLTGVSQ